VAIITTGGYNTFHPSPPSTVLLLIMQGHSLL